jgi:hypothetical protein
VSHNDIVPNVLRDLRFIRRYRRSDPVSRSDLYRSRWRNRITDNFGRQYIPNQHNDNSDSDNHDSDDSTNVQVIPGSNLDHVHPTTNESDDGVEVN